jgi:hypothetical protein
LRRGLSGGDDTGGGRRSLDRREPSWSDHCSAAARAASSEQKETSMNRLCVLVLVLAACTDDDGGDGDGSCSGSVLACPLAELSARQEMEACDLISASIDAPAGTKYECTSGPNEGQFLTVETAATCVSHDYKPGCPVTVQQTIDCFKAAKTNVCSAFDDGGVCGRLFNADVISRCY